MCDPISIASAALSIGSAYAGYKGAENQAEIQTKMYHQNKLNANADLRHGYMTSQQRQSQEMAAASQQIEERRLEAAKQLATSRVAAGESGVSGFSVERLMRDIQGTAARDVSTIEQNRDWNVSQIQNQMLGLKNQTKSRISSMTPGVKPNPWVYGLQAGAGVTNAYSDYKLRNS